MSYKDCTNAESSLTVLEPYVLDPRDNIQAVVEMEAIKGGRIEKILPFAHLEDNVSFQEILKNTTFNGL